MALHKHSKLFFPADIDLSGAFDVTKRNRPMKKLPTSGKPDEKSASVSNFIVNSGNRLLGSPEPSKDLLGDTTRKMTDPGFRVDIDMDKMTGSKKG